LSRQCRPHSSAFLLTTVAILGTDSVVDSALCVLLEGSGYHTSPLDAHPTGIADELLEGADLLLLAPRLDEGVREAFPWAPSARATREGSTRP
jgi:hypothetical protein